MPNNVTPNLTTLLDRILAHPDVRAKRGEWYDYQCNNCPCAYPIAPNNSCPMCGTIRLVHTDESPVYTGPALNTDDGEGHLLKLADEVSAGDHKADTIWEHSGFWICSIWRIVCIAGRDVPGQYCGAGPTRRAAVIDALHKAVVGNTQQQQIKD